MRGEPLTTSATQEELNGLDQHCAALILLVNSLDSIATVAAARAFSALSRELI